MTRLIQCSQMIVNAYLMTCNSLVRRECVLDELALGVEQVHQLVCVDFLGGGEDDHLVPLRHDLEELPEVWSRSHEHLHSTRIHIQNTSQQTDKIHYCH